MLLRSFFSSCLMLAVVASAPAQTAPTKKATKTATRRTVTKPRVAASRSTTMQGQTTTQPTPGGRNDIGPGGNGAVGSTESADSKGQNVYAAPGMPVNVDNPKKVEGYNGPAPTTKSRTGTTLTPR